MNQSESINELAAALAKAQGEIRNAPKDSLNPHFKAKYADLASVWSVIRDPLSKNGLSVVQLVSDGPATITVTTKLLHSSGQWIEGSIMMEPTGRQPQQVGSCITYARRYGLSAMVGVAPDDDDDAQLASAPPPQQQRPAQNVAPIRQDGESKARMDLFGKIKTIRTKIGYSVEKVCKECEIEDLSKASVSELKEVLEKLKVIEKEVTDQELNRIAFPMNEDGDFSGIVETPFR